MSKYQHAASVRIGHGRFSLSSIIRLRRFLRVAHFAMIVLTAILVVAPPAAAAGKVIRVGYQKYGTFLLLKARGLLEKNLQPLGFTVEWTEFPGGPQLLSLIHISEPTRQA